ncbi:uncharacterized protein [Diadema antillarum]|uniref:uncharacterized protein n=1 Tax=Diadema antillarum TaxID=105358 RepID=UPI003A8496FB
MGMDEILTHSVECVALLYNASGLLVNQTERKALHFTSGKREIIFTDLDPFSAYTIKSRCEIGNDLSTISPQHALYNFTTAEEVPSRGPSILEPTSTGLGCENPDRRNFTLTIQPPEQKHRNGILTAYEIRYRPVSEEKGSQDWTSVVEPIPSPVPPATEVVLADLSRWNSYEIVVYANNSKGGKRSRLLQLDRLLPETEESLLRNATKREIRPDVWLINWLPPWPTDSGDCILNYTVTMVTVSGTHFDTANTSSYTLDLEPLDQTEGVSVTITALIYNGTGPPAKGTPLEMNIDDPDLSSPSKSGIVILGALIPVVIITLAVVCVTVCIRIRLTRSKDSSDLRENKILKSAKAMGLQRPKPPTEREKFTDLPNRRPPNDSENDSEVPAVLLNRAEESQSTAVTVGDVKFIPPGTADTTSISEESTKDTKGTAQDWCVSSEADAKHSNDINPETAVLSLVVHTGPSKSCGEESVKLGSQPFFNSSRCDPPLDSCENHVIIGTDESGSLSITPSFLSSGYVSSCPTEVREDHNVDCTDECGSLSITPSPVSSWHVSPPLPEVRKGGMVTCFNESCSLSTTPIVLSSGYVSSSPPEVLEDNVFTFTSENGSVTTTPSALSSDYVRSSSPEVQKDHVFLFTSENDSTRNTPSALSSSCGSSKHLEFEENNAIPSTEGRRIHSTTPLLVSSSCETYPPLQACADHISTCSYGSGTLDTTRVVASTTASFPPSEDQENYVTTCDESDTSSTSPPGMSSCCVNPAIPEAHEERLIACTTESDTLNTIPPVIMSSGYVTSPSLQFQEDNVINCNDGSGPLNALSYPMSSGYVSSPPLIPH